MKNFRFHCSFLSFQFANGIDKVEDVLTSADDLFAEVQAAYDVSEPIYGVGKQEEELLSMFEQEGHKRL